MRIIPIQELKELSLDEQLVKMSKLKTKLFSKEVKAKFGELDKMLKPGVDYSLKYMVKGYIPLPNRIYFLQSAIYTILNNKELA